MKLKTIVACVIGLVLAGPAEAQLGGGGGYVGGGVSFDAFSVTDVSFGFGIANGKANVAGIGLSVFGGYDFQKGKLVFGPEGSLSISMASGDNGAFFRPVDLRRLLEVRGRFGYKTGKFLGYGAFGFVQATFRADHQGNGNAADIFSTKNSGISFAGGVDIDVTERAAVRVEYGYYMFGEQNFLFYAGDFHTYTANGSRFVGAFTWRFGGSR